MSLFTELRRRNVFRVAAAYLIVGWLLTEISTTLLPTFGAPDWIAKTLIFVFALGFVPVLIFAWAFEMTADGIKRERDVDRDHSITSSTGKKLDYVTIIAVIAGIAFVGFSKVSDNSSPVVDTEIVETTGSPSVAVLPFVNMSGNAENEYFSDGLTETLLHMLAQIPELKVAARTSSFAFKGKDTDIREIASVLEVAHVLEGSVQRAGDRVRITAQLIRADDGFHVWSENFDRTLDDVFAIQDEIAGKVGLALSESLLGTPVRVVVGVGTENLKAYDLYLHALSENAKGSYGSLQNAEGLLKDALALDPGFHEAKLELANNYYEQWGTGLLEGVGPLDDAMTFVGQVLDQKPDSVRATGLLYALEIVSFIQKGNFEWAQDSLILLEQHVDANPGDLESRVSLAGILNIFNREEDAMQQQLALVELDPMNAAVHYDLSVTYFILDRLDEARASSLRSLEIEALQPSAQAFVGIIDRELGDGLGFLKNHLKAIEIDPKDHELPGGIAIFLYDLGLPEYAEQYRSRVLATAPSSPFAYRLNLEHVKAAGDVEGARQIAKKIIEDDVDNRAAAYSIAIRFLVFDGIQNGTVKEVVDYLTATIPGFSGGEQKAAGKHRFAIYEAIPGLQAALPEEEFIERMNSMWEMGSQFGFKPTDDPWAHSFDLVARGDSPGAANALVDGFFDDPIATNLTASHWLEIPIFEEVIKDPRVQMEMQRWSAEEDVLREEVRSYLESLN